LSGNELFVPFTCGTSVGQDGTEQFDAKKSGVF